MLYYTNERVSEDSPQYGSEEGHHGESVEEDGGIRVAEPDHSGDEQDQDSWTRREVKLSINRAETFQPRIP